jgi:phage terminase small subunit
MKKLTRKQIAEGLDAVPMTQILLGSNQAGIALTQKQKAFAAEVVKTGNKSAAYRKAYNHKGKPETAARDAQKVANNPKVATYIQALEAAKEAETYLLPARLRSIAIHRLTGLALNEEIAPAQQLKALELIGKMTEVALFTERRELIQTTSSQTMREQLLNSIRLAISTDGAEDVEAIEIDSLLDDISGAALPDDAETLHISMDDAAPDQQIDKETPDPSAIPIVETPPDPDPQK